MILMPFVTKNKNSRENLLWVRCYAWSRDSTAFNFGETSKMQIKLQKILKAAGILIIGVGIIVCRQPAFAQTTDEEARELAHLAQNPLTNAIILPLQYTVGLGYGPNNDDTAQLLNIQPVIPFKLNEDWDLITRTIIPVQNLPITDGDDATGIGDINLSGFFSPSTTSKWIWGIGPTLTVPSATDDSLGSERLSVGPAFVILSIDGPWVYGALIENQWSVAGNDDREDVNTMLLNPFLNYNLPKGWFFVSYPNITANWEASGGNVWTIPVGGGIGKIFKIGNQAVSAQLAYYYDVQSPEEGPNQEIQFQFTLLFPTQQEK